ncbi:ATP-binding cassette domain-containing protein [Micromonospora sp. NPDC047707]|uniref:ABC transporter ATP-binding protein n=1 Tax=Micromonospora sp. NPDC047707 TaxID=3154498 RepID=UPI0034537421
MVREADQYGQALRGHVGRVTERPRHRFYTHLRVASRGDQGPGRRWYRRVRGRSMSAGPPGENCFARTGRREARTAALTWLERLGVAELADTRPGEMSGGQQQRCATARALVTEPRVLFADEPTGALDTLTGEQVLTQLVRLAREQGTAVVLVTHEPRVAAYADREIVLRDGLVDHTGLGLDAPLLGERR